MSADDDGRGGPSGEGSDSEDAAPGDVAPEPDLPGVPATRRNRAKSAVLWGAVGFFAFLVLGQGYLLLGGDLPFAYAWLFVIAAVVGGLAGGIVYLTEHRMGAKRRT